MNVTQDLSILGLVWNASVIVQAVMAQVDVGDGRGITVVTADRVLRDRVAAAGARSVSPSSLLDQL